MSPNSTGIQEFFLVIRPYSSIHQEERSPSPQGGGRVLSLLFIRFSLLGTFPTSPSRRVRDEGPQGPFCKRLTIATSSRCSAPAHSCFSCGTGELTFPFLPLCHSTLRVWSRTPILDLSFGGETFQFSISYFIRFFLIFPCYTGRKPPTISAERGGKPPYNLVLY